MDENVIKLIDLCDEYFNEKQLKTYGKENEYKCFYCQCDFINKKHSKSCPTIRYKKIKKDIFKKPCSKYFNTYELIESTFNEIKTTEDLIARCKQGNLIKFDCSKILEDIKEIP